MKKSSDRNKDSWTENKWERGGCSISFLITFKRHFPSKYMQSNKGLTNTPTKPAPTFENNVTYQKIT